LIVPDAQIVETVQVAARADPTSCQR
jgi:hypothetical protein